MARIKNKRYFPKRIYYKNQWYDLQSVTIQTDNAMYSVKTYLQVHYKNKMWGYDLYLSRFVASYVMQNALAITMQMFLDIEEGIIKENRIK